MRLSEAALEHLPSRIGDPGYDRKAQASGILHFGIGAFHRAHQAWYTDRAMEAGDRDWAITGVSMRSSDVADQLNPQDGLYTVTERSGPEGPHRSETYRLVGAVRQVLVASKDRAAIVAQIASPKTRIISFTITEKGYCRAADGSLSPELAGDGSVFAVLAEGLAIRRAQGAAGMTLLSCDNLSDNGRVLERLVGEYCARHDPALGHWIAANCAFPNSMVDRIVPATTEGDRIRLEAELGLRDDAAVVTEPFSQWVIEDRFAGPRPRWEEFGAQIVADVTAYETAKLRMLNGAHSLLAYCGLERGFTFVHEAVADAQLRSLAKQLMLVEAAPTVEAARGQDLAGYAADLLERFANPALNHRLIQIAMDGSQKIPQRWLATLSENHRMGRPCPAIQTGLAAWLYHLRGGNGVVDDPLAAPLACAAANPDPMTALFERGGPMGGFLSFPIS